MGKDILLAIFCSPAYFAIHKKWGAFVINLFFWLIAWIMLLSIVLAVFSPIPWMVGFVHAFFYVRTDMLHEQAEIMAEKLAEKMAAAKSGPQ